MRRAGIEQPRRVNIRSERVIHFVLLRRASWEFSSLLPWLISHLGDSWETVATQVPRCSGCLGSKWKGKRVLMIFVQVTFALSVGEYIWLFVPIRDKSPFLSFFQKFFFFFTEGEFYLAVYLSQVSGCMNLFADFCYVLRVVFNKRVGLSAASDPGVMKPIVVRAWEKYSLLVF